MREDDRAFFSTYNKGCRLAAFIVFVYCIMFLKLLSLLLLLNFTAFSSPCDSNDFKRLLFLVKEGRVNGNELVAAKDIVFRLNDAKCRDYEIKHDGEVQAIATLTQIFGEICRLANSPQAVTAYVEYLDRNAGSAEEQLAISFESIFRNNPSMVFITITKNGERLPYDLLEYLAFGFINNSYPSVNAANYRDVFLQLHPDIPLLYQKYSRQIDTFFSIVEKGLNK